MQYYRLIAATLATALLSACGGGSMAGATTGSASTASTVATLALTLPSAAASAGARSAEYISLNTQSFVILTDGKNPQILNLDKTSPSCHAINNDASLSCAIAIQTTAGTHTFTLTSYAQVNGAGAVLSTNSTGPIIVADSNNTPVALSLLGVPASAELSLQNAHPPSGTPAQIPLTVVLKDASGAIIVGSSQLSNPVTLTSSDATNAPLSKTTLASAADSAGVTANYNGSSLASVTYGATSSDLSSANVTAAVLTPFVPHLYTGFSGWTVIRPGESAEIPAAVTQANGVWSNPQDAPFPTVWIADTADGGSGNRPDGIYKYFYRFNLPAANTTLAAIGDFSYLADNCVTRVGLNGVFTNLASCNGVTTFDNNFFGAPTSLHLASFLHDNDVLTNNTLEIDVENQATGSGSPTGLAVRPL